MAVIEAVTGAQIGEVNKPNVNVSSIINDAITSYPSLESNRDWFARMIAEHKAAVAADHAERKALTERLLAKHPEDAELVAKGYYVEED